MPILLTYILLQFDIQSLLGGRAKTCMPSPQRPKLLQFARAEDRYPLSTFNSTTVIASFYNPAMWDPQHARLQWCFPVLHPPRQASDSTLTPTLTQRARERQTSLSACNPRRTLVTEAGTSKLPTDDPTPSQPRVPRRAGLLVSHRVPPLARLVHALAHLPVRRFVHLPSSPRARSLPIPLRRRMEANTPSGSPSAIASSHSSHHRVLHHAPWIARRYTPLWRYHVMTATLLFLQTAEIGCYFP